MLFQFIFFARKSVTRDISSAIYIFLFLQYLIKKNYINNSSFVNFVHNILTIEYGLAWGVAICGLIVNIFYKRTNIDRRWADYQLRLIDVFGHILPLILLCFFAPEKTNLKFSTIVLSYVMLGLLYTFIGTKIANIYVGVPPVILYVLFPFIMLSAIYIKYFLKT